MLLSRTLRNSIATASRRMYHFTADTMNQNIVRAEYAVRGLLVQKSLEYEADLATGKSSLPFDNIIACNIGNPQSLNQKPISFFRQVLALVNAPELINDPSSPFPPDVHARAESYVKAVPGGPGAYSHSQGVPVFRQEVADFLTARDGFPARVEDLFLTDGASQGVQTMLKALIRSPSDGILVPLPQYPLYSAAISMLNGTMVSYELDEDNRWGLSITELQSRINKAKADGVSVRALAIISPGNPTGQVLTVNNMQDIIKFCEKSGIMLLADEVYQENVYASDRSFTSFRKVVLEMKSSVELVSFHSTSKGFIGECGRRGGYMHLENICPTAASQLYKLASISLCSNIDGQMMVGLMSNPPKTGDPSYDQYASERDGILQSLKRRAKKLVEAYNKMEGVECNNTDGALYTFPKITIPNKAVSAASEAGLVPDTFYCLEMLKATGVVVVPGSGFGQKDGTWHFRSTILPAEEHIDEVIERCSNFHASFMEKYK